MKRMGLVFFCMLVLSMPAFATDFVVRQRIVAPIAFSSGCDCVGVQQFVQPYAVQAFAVQSYYAPLAFQQTLLIREQRRFVERQRVEIEFRRQREFRSRGREVQRTVIRSNRVFGH